MKIITLCGSTKFRKEFEKAQEKETLNGNIVISVGLFGHESGMDMSGATKRMLDQLHFKKIDLADEILVINPGGYIGLSTCDEIHYAIACRKDIHWLEIPACWEDPLKPIGHCKDCYASIDSRERGYAEPCLSCSRPEMSNFKLYRI